MVTFARFIFLFVALVLLAGCADTRKIRKLSSFDAEQQREAIYVVPFDATLVPPDFGDPVFNDFIDRLNFLKRSTKIGRFVILKEDLKDVEPAWLIKQTYISGDLWGYLEKSGCCSTELKVKSRIYLYEPGKNDPSLEIFVPAEDFFEHDKTTMVTARTRMGKQLAHDLAAVIIGELTP